MRELIDQLGTTSRNVPAGASEDIRTELDTLRAAITDILGDHAAGSAEITDQLNTAMCSAAELTHELVQLRRIIADWTVYHQHG